MRRGRCAGDLLGELAEFVEGPVFAGAIGREVGLHGRSLVDGSSRPLHLEVGPRPSGAASLLCNGSDVQCATRLQRSDPTM